MARLVYEITGDISGLESAINQASNFIKDAGAKSSQINITIPDISPQIKAGVAALDQLDQKLSVITGNATLFGDSVKLQTQEVGAYQTAINSLLANGFDPMDGDVQRLKQRLDDFTGSLRNVKNVEAEVSTSTKETFEEVQAFLDATRNAQSQTTPAASISATSISAPSIGGLGQSSALTSLNQQLVKGTITVQEYNAALIEANLSQHLISESATGAAGAIEAEVGVIQGLKEQLASLNAQRIIAPQEDLAVLNAEIQQTEVALQQATNIGKVGFDQMGNSIRGVSVQNVNGQLISLSNNLFGARQISKDLVRTFDSTSVGTFARSIGLLAVDFLFFAQNAQFATGTTKTATTAIAVEGEVAGASALSTGALGAAFSSLLTPTSLIVLGIAAAGAAFIAYENSQKNATKTATEHLKAIRDQKQALDDYISTLSVSQRVETESAQGFAESVTQLNRLLDAVKDNKGSLQDETEAFENLQGKFPEYFSGITQAQIGTQAFTDAINKANDGLKNLALANAAFKLSGDAAVSQIKNQVALETSVDNALNAFKQLAAAQNAIGDQKTGNNVREQSFVILGLQRAYDAANQEVQKYADAVNSASSDQDKLNKIAAQFQKKSTTDQTPDNRIGFLENEISQLNTILPKATNYQEVLAKIKADQAELDALLGKNVSFTDVTDQFDSLKQKLDEILQKSSSLAGNSGITGYASDVAAIVKQFTDLSFAIGNFSIQVSKAFDKGQLTRSEANTLLAPLPAIQSAIPQNEDAAINQARIKDAQATADAIQKINDQFGIKEQAGFNEELSRVKKLYDSITQEAQKNSETLQQINDNYQKAIAAAGGNATALRNAKLVHDAQVQQAQDAQAKVAAAQADLLPAIQAIDQKYIQQETETYGKITDIANQAFEALDTGEAARTDKINLEWQKRITSANAYFDKLRDLAKASNLSPAATANINAVQTQVNAVIKLANIQQVSEEISKNFAAAMQSAVQGFVSNFYTSLTTLGQQRQDLDNKYLAQYAAATDQSTINQINNLKKLEEQSTLSFGAIFSSLVSKFNSTFNESILNSFTKQFTESLGKTLIAPTAKQLTISPEQQAAQQVSATLKSAGTSLADEIKQAGIDFANTVRGISINPGLLSGASGGSAALGGEELAASGAGGQVAGSIATAGTDFNEEVSAAGASAGGAIAAGATAAAATTTVAATTAGTKIVSAGNQLSSKLAGAAAAASLIGGLISGATSPTSSVGQGVGGALQGAGEGALIGTAIAPGIGTAIGAVAGGVIGLVSGLFGASKAKKQQELQQQQLEQQQITNELLARQNALAYTSSIIGRMTQQGIVTGVDLNSFGQLTATVSGKSIQFVLDRQTNGR